jgi:hypothetical protein
MAESKRPEIEWPEGGEVLFQIGHDERNNAMPRAPHATFSTIAEGYYMHARLAVEHVNQEGFYADRFVYPIVFCYRQFIELAMKDVIRNGRQLLSEPGDYLKTHELDKLWNAVRPILMKVWPQGPKTDLDNVWKILQQLHDVDPYSDAFRFPEGLDGKRPLSNIEHINIQNVGMVMNRIYNFFSGCMGAISQYLDEARDAERDSYEYDTLSD